MCLSVAPWSFLLFFVCFNGGRIRGGVFSSSYTLQNPKFELEKLHRISLCLVHQNDARDDDDDDDPRRVKFGR